MHDHERSWTVYYDIFILLIVRESVFGSPVIMSLGLNSPKKKIKINCLFFIVILQKWFKLASLCIEFVSGRSNSISCLIKFFGKIEVFFLESQVDPGFGSRPRDSIIKHRMCLLFIAGGIIASVKNIFTVKLFNLKFTQYFWRIGL